MDLEQLKRIKILVTDVDGVLTDGGITYHSDGSESKTFNVKDGQIVKFLRKRGIKVGVITGRSSNIVQRRCEELGFDFIDQGVEDKLGNLNAHLKKLQLDLANVAYIGDDINDLETLKQVGFSACPSDAVDVVKQSVHYVSNKSGGKGVFRDVADLILINK